MRAALQSYPLWTFKLSYEVLRAAAAYSELQTLAGFFLSVKGSYDSFLYSDPTDNTVTAQAFGVGDGATQQFQLVRAWGSFVEPTMAINGTPSIYVGGVLKTLITDYTIDGLGMVTFVTAPASSAALTWTGSYYYRCRFTNDAAEFNQMMRDLWELKTLEFVGSTGNKV
jgi:uncharacterized protein (TIGR02217 family)